jgi:hypothetical protein
MKKKREVRVKSQILKHREALRKEAREKKNKEKLEYVCRNKRPPFVKDQEIIMKKKDKEIAKHNFGVLDEMLNTMEKEEKEKEERRKKNGKLNDENV